MKLFFQKQNHGDFNPQQWKTNRNKNRQKQHYEAHVTTTSSSTSSSSSTNNNNPTFNNDSSSEKTKTEPPQPLPTSTNPFIILSLSTTASKSEIKKAYREKAMRYHPDTWINAKTSTEEEKQRANDDFARINAAYKSLMDSYDQIDPNGYDTSSSVYGWSDGNSAQTVANGWNHNKPKTNPNQQPQPNYPGEKYESSSESFNSKKNYKHYGANDFHTTYSSASNEPFNTYDRERSAQRQQDLKQHYEDLKSNRDKYKKYGGTSSNMGFYEAYNETETKTNDVYNVHLEQEGRKKTRKYYSRNTDDLNSSVGKKGGAGSSTGMNSASVGTSRYAKGGFGHVGASCDVGGFEKMYYDEGINGQRQQQQQQQQQQQVQPQKKVVINRNGNQVPLNNGKRVHRQQPPPPPQQQQVVNNMYQQQPPPPPMNPMVNGHRQQPPLNVNMNGLRQPPPPPQQQQPINLHQQPAVNGHHQAPPVRPVYNKQVQFFNKDSINTNNISNGVNGKQQQPRRMQSPPQQQQQQQQQLYQQGNYAHPNQYFVQQQQQQPPPPPNQQQRYIPQPPQHPPPPHYITNGANGMPQPNNNIPQQQHRRHNVPQPPRNPPPPFYVRNNGANGVAHSYGQPSQMQQQQQYIPQPPQYPPPPQQQQYATVQQQQQFLQQQQQQQQRGYIPQPPQHPPPPHYVTNNGVPQHYQQQVQQQVRRQPVRPTPHYSAAKGTRQGYVSVQPRNYSNNGNVNGRNVNARQQQLGSNNVRATAMNNVAQPYVQQQQQYPQQRFVQQPPPPPQQQQIYQQYPQQAYAQYQQQQPPQPQQSVYQTSAQGYKREVYGGTSSDAQRKKKEGSDTFSRYSGTDLDNDVARRVRSTAHQAPQSKYTGQGYGGTSTDAFPTRTAAGRGVNGGAPQHGKYSPQSRMMQKQGTTATAQTTSATAQHASVARSPTNVQRPNPSTYGGTSTDAMKRNTQASATASTIKNSRANANNAVTNHNNPVMQFDDSATSKKGTVVQPPFTQKGYGGTSSPYMKSSVGKRYESNTKASASPAKASTAGYRQSPKTEVEDRRYGDFFDADSFHDKWNSSNPDPKDRLNKATAAAKNGFNYAERISAEEEQRKYNEAVLEEAKRRAEALTAKLRAEEAKKSARSDNAVIESGLLGLAMNAVTSLFKSPEQSSASKNTSAKNIQFSPYEACTMIEMHQRDPSKDKEKALDIMLRNKNVPVTRTELLELYNKYRDGKIATNHTWNI